MIEKENIISALKTVYDPEIPVNIWDLGLIYDIQIMGRDVKIVMTFTSPTCPMMEEILEMVKNAVGEVVGVNQVQVELVWQPIWDISKMSDAAKLELDLTDQGW